nr:anti-sigma-K factor rskA [uncultured bacterium]
MNDRESTPCGGLIEYLTGEGTDMQRKRFEKHMATCSSCQEEAILWHQVWDRLADDTEMLDLPADLKDEVMGPLFAKENQSPISSPRLPINKSTFRFAKWGIGIAILLSVFLSGWLLRGWQVQWQETAANEVSGQTPASIETLFHLSAIRSNGKFDDSPRAYGVACLVRSSDKEQLVVYVFGSPQTKNGEAYQVWLLKDGQRTSAGTFTVGSSGIGIMTLPLSKGIPEMDAIGVTLEPDSRSESPRGPKMFGSSPQDSTGDA